MRSRHLALSVLLCLTILAACGGEDEPTAPSESMIGKWVGTYSLEGDPDTSDYTFFFAGGDSTIGVIDGLGEEGDIEAAGSWTVVGDTVFTTYTYDGGGSTYNTRAVLNSSRTRMTGIWGLDPNDSDGGTFTLRQQ